MCTSYDSFECIFYFICKDERTSRDDKNGATDIRISWVLIRGTLELCQEVRLNAEIDKVMIHEGDTLSKII